MLDLSALAFLGAGALIIYFLYIVLHNQRRAYAKVVYKIVTVRIKDCFSSQTKEQRVLQYVVENAVRGDPQSVVDHIDKYCNQREWAMNVGDQKGDLF